MRRPGGAGDGYRGGSFSEGLHRLTRKHWFWARSLPDLGTNTSESMVLYDTATDVPQDIVTALNAHNTPFEDFLCSDSTS
jgi:hypothetical protein